MPFNCKCTKNTKMKLDDFTTTNSKKEKLVCIIFDDILKLQYHIKNMCKKTSLKLSAMCCVAPFRQFITKENLIQCLFFSHSVNIALWFRCAVEEYLITK